MFCSNRRGPCFCAACVYREVEGRAASGGVGAAGGAAQLTVGTCEHMSGCVAAAGNVNTMLDETTGRSGVQCAGVRLINSGIEQRHSEGAAERDDSGRSDSGVTGVIRRIPPARRYYSFA
jgi:hypothetical protein